MTAPGRFPTPDRTVLVRRSAVAAALIAYAALLLWCFDPYASGSDTSGYLNHAKLISEGTLHATLRSIEGLPPSTLPPDAYTPLGLKPAPDGNGLVPTYPSGLPLMLAGASRVFGWNAAAGLVVVGYALLGIAVTYLLARRLGLAPGWAGLTVAAIAVSPLYLLYSVQIMSDVPSLACVGAALVAAWDAGCSGDRRRAQARAFAAGLLLSLAVLIRPNSAIALVPVAVALGVSPRRWAMLVLGGVPGALWFFAHSRAAYGSVLTTGYGDIGYLFSTDFIGASLANYARWIPILFTPLVLPILALPWIRAVPSRTKLVAASCVLTYFAFYAPYRTTHETWWYLRYLLPAAPALMTGGMLAVCGPLERLGGARIRAMILILVILNGAWWTRHFGVLNTKRNDRDYVRTSEWLACHARADSVVTAWEASGALYYYTSYVIVRWDMLQARDFVRIGKAAREQGRPVYAALFGHEREQAFGGPLPGRWTKAHAERDLTLWRWEGNAP
jgi:hypothetical protein